MFKQYAFKYKYLCGRISTVPSFKATGVFLEYHLVELKDQVEFCLPINRLFFWNYNALGLPRFELVFCENTFNLTSNYIKLFVLIFKTIMK